MTTEHLTSTEETIQNYLPATAIEVADHMAYRKADGSPNRTTVYDHIRSLKNKGVEIEQNDEGEYVIVDDTAFDVLNISTENRTSPAAKQSITRKGREVLKEIEREVKEARSEIGPCVADGGIMTDLGGTDVLIPCSDDHFGDVVTNYRDEVDFDSEILDGRIAQKFDAALDKIATRQSLGFEITTVIPLLNGDHVTHETIYSGQAWEVEETIRGQLSWATKTYGRELTRLSKLFEQVIVPCQHGNHGEFRIDGASKDMNADDFFFDRLELYCQAAGLENVTFIRSDRADATNFPICGGREAGGWTGHMRHGQNVPSHIGTSSPLNKWKSHLDNYHFDVGFRGHYHEHRMEPVLGRPVYEIPSLKPGGDYEASLGVGSAPMGMVLGVTESELPAFIDYVHYENPSTGRIESDYRPGGA